MPISSAATASSTVWWNASAAVWVMPPPGCQAPNERKPIFLVGRSELLIAAADVAARKTDPQMQPLAAYAQAVLAAVDGSRHVSDQDLIEVGADVAHLAPSRTAVSRWACTNRTAMAPSPTAVAHRLVDPERTSPTAKTPGTFVSSKLAVLAATPVRMNPSSSRATTSSSHSVHGLAPRNRNRCENGRSSPPLSVTAAKCPSWP